VGVGLVIRSVASLDFLHQELKLAIGFPRRINHLLLEALGNCAKTCLDLIGSILSSLQEGHSASNGWSDLPE